MAVGASGIAVRLPRARVAAAIMAMRRSALQLVARLARSAEGVASATLRPLAIGALATANAAPAAAKVPARPLGTTAPSFAAEADYAQTVFYPEAEAEVGEQAPGFKLPGERRSGRVVADGGRRQAAAAAPACNAWPRDGMAGGPRHVDMPSVRCSTRRSSQPGCCASAAGRPTRMRRPPAPAARALISRPQPWSTARSRRSAWRTSRAATPCSSSTPRTSREGAGAGGR